MMAERITTYSEEAAKKARIETARELAREMLKGNMPIEKVIRYPRLDELTVSQLREEIDNE